MSPWPSSGPRQDGVGRGSHREPLGAGDQPKSNTTFATALGQVTTARQTMGWGAIAKANQPNLGRLVSDVTSR